MASERTRLLDNSTSSLPYHNGHLEQPAHRTFLGALKGEGEPSFAQSYKHFWFGSYLNLFLVFVPLSFIAHHLNWDSTLRFAFSFFAIIPLASLLGEATDQMSVTLGATVSGLLNASFGNAVEIIVGIAALLQDEMRIVQTSLLGSILSNLLLVLGSSFVAGGYVEPQSSFRATGAQAAASLMTLACITLVIPAAYHSTQLGNSQQNTNMTTSPIESPVLLKNSDLDHNAQVGLVTISRGTAIVLLIVYVAYLVFQLKVLPKIPQDGYQEQEQEQEQEEAKMSIVSAASALLIVTVITSFCADYLVASIEEFSEHYSIPKAFIGTILIPIVANAAEHVTSIWMAMKHKMELSIQICVGSSIQIASFVIPLLVIIGWITGHNLTLFFYNFETIALFVSVILVCLLVQDGKSNYMEGVMLLALYAVIALSFWATPSPQSDIVLKQLL